MIPMSTAEAIAEELLPLVRRFCVEPCSVALGGSHAKGSGDLLSDVDIYLFGERVIPAELRTELVTGAFGNRSAVTAWGSDDPFTEAGTDFLYGGVRIECWLRNSNEVEATIVSCLRGEVRRAHSIWAVMGFFNYVVLADVQSMRALEDPCGRLARWKNQVRTFPEPLREAILTRFLREAAFWPGNPHYRSAVERGDLLYTSAIVQQTVHALIQVAFALNREYFPGEKRLSASLDTLPIKPQRFASRLHAVLARGSEPGVEELRGQSEALGSLVAEMVHLVSPRTA